MNRQANVIALTALLCIVCLAPAALAEQTVEQQVDSLFMVASSGEVMYRDMVEPAKEALAEIGEAAVPFLIAKLDTKSARERLTIIEILKKIGSPAVPYLVRALKRDQPLIVQRVCWALGDIKDSSAAEPLIGVCGHERWQVRDQAIAALGKIGDPAAVDNIGWALVDTIGQVRKSAAVAAGRMELAQYMNALVHMLGDEFYGARMSAYHTLLKLDTTDVIAAVADSLGSPNSMLGNLGCQLLGEVGTDAAIDLLLEQTGSDDPNRRAHAGVALVKADPLDNCRYRRLFVDTETDRLVKLKVKSAIAAVDDGQR